ncbi:MAG: hypothetical protein ABIH82_02340 [Candidatus Woesearchaeota archaeon]
MVNKLLMDVEDAGLFGKVMDYVASAVVILAIPYALSTAFHLDHANNAQYCLDHCVVGTNTEEENQKRINLLNTKTYHLERAINPFIDLVN